MADKLDLQLGRVEKINADGTIKILDFSSGGVLYSNVDIEHTASMQQQPVEGEHVLFFTMPSPISSRFAKVVRFYGSQDADTRLVRSSPVDMDQGEYKIVSQSGNTVYVANGALYFSGVGQHLTMLDNPAITQLYGSHLQIVSSDGTLINEKNGILTIQKGEINDLAETPAVEIASPTVTLEMNGSEIKLNGSTPVARKDDPTVSTATEDAEFWTWLNGFIAVFQAWVPVPTDGGAVLKTALTTYLNTNPVPSSLTGKIQSGSSTVKAG